MKLLVACSEPVTRLLLQSTLGRAGHEVIGCRSGRDALDAVQGSGSPQLAFLDAALPGQDALSACQALAARLPRPRIVVLTRGGSAAASDIVAARAAGADRTLDRPLTPEAILACVSQVEDEQRRERGQVAPRPAERDPLLGRVVDGKYEVLDVVGRGGMGTIYRARHLLVGELVALKVIHPNHVARQGFRERFVREARVMLKVVHPNVIPVRECGVTKEDLPYLTMDLSSGRSLAELARGAGGRLDEARVVRLGRQMALALVAAHEAGVVHRDLKPENVLVEAEDRVRVCDFGLAKVLHDERPSDVTGLGTVVGTPYYMSPEQAAGERVDGRTDVYSLGCILYELVCGARVFEARTVSRLLRAHLTEPPVAPSERGVVVSPRFEALVLRMLAKDSAERPSAAGVVEALEAIAARPPTTRRLRVLVADDSPVNRRLVTGLLERWGHRVTVACDGAEAFERFAAAPDGYDLLLVDGAMPRMGGEELARAVRAHPRASAGLPIVSLTASDGPEARARCLAAGMTDVLPKPVRIADLEAVLARAGASEAAASVEAAPFDRHAALERVEGDADLLRETLDLLLQDIERLLRELRAARAAGDMHRLARAAHELKGSAGNCGAMAIAAAAGRLEEAARRGDVEGAAGELAGAEREVTRTLPLLQAA
ncbi:MAG: response regulator [Planctomycetes bacterium]|nr:response regulator [Planctomycetota bacterium]